jgi:ribosomal protein S18 acetylase RimI-like enzyme
VWFRLDDIVSATKRSKVGRIGNVTPALTRRRSYHLPMKTLLDRITWHTLSGPHAKFARGTDSARRYAPGFSPIVGFASSERPDFAALADYCEPGEHFYCDGWSGVAPAGWHVDVESTMFKMLWEGSLSVDDDAPDTIRLGPEHVAQAVDLATLTLPGPFGPRTIELGEYFGCFEGQRLVAMAGERMQAGALREISGVCTHPDFQGRGLARRLMAKLIRRQIQRNEVPFLHVMRDNARAHGLYEKMGFRDYRESVVRVVSRR